MKQELLDKYFYKLKILNETIWDNKATKVKINNWLDNFENNEEKLNALYLLTHFIYFNSYLVKNLLICIYRDLYKYGEIQAIRMLNEDTLEEKLITEEFEKRISKTRFVILGNPSESSAHLMYIFRTENRLSKHLFMTDGDIENKIEDIDHFVFVDDLCGSGQQAVDYSLDILPKIHKNYPKAKTSYFMMISTKDGKKHIKTYGAFDNVDSILEMDESFKCFSEISRIYNTEELSIDKTFTEEFCAKYGKDLIATIIRRDDPDLTNEELDEFSEENKFGFNNGQLLIGFNHNTPDNTLPIFWYSEGFMNWTPIFKRHNKVY